jgi:endonuclease/exonuclease/phosphatase family metal-dependent hydrolase
MRTIIICIFCFLGLGQVSAQPGINVMSYNIRYNNPGDGVNAWPNRKEWVKDLVTYYNTDILCVQEALKDQVDDLLTDSPFELEGAGRDDGQTKGEYTAIYYNKDRFKKNQSGTFWLSETPEKPSKGWDAHIIRICTWIKLTDRQTKKDFFVFNTHYDHMGVLAREKSSELIVQKIKKIAGKYPVILSGDLNTKPGTSPISVLNSYLKDSREVSKAKPYGPEGTFNAFKFDAELKDRIDYIFVNEQVDVLSYAVLSDSKDQRYPSDHLPVLVKVKIR